MTDKKLIWIIIAVLIIAWIILPTGTPEDLVTTVPLLGAVGWKKFLIIAFITLALLAIVLIIIHNNKKIKELLQQKFI